MTFDLKKCKIVNNNFPFQLFNHFLIAILLAQPGKPRQKKTQSLRDSNLPTCNAEGGWVCYYDLYVEFTNEQGVARVDEALASWSLDELEDLEGITKDEAKHCFDIFKRHWIGSMKLLFYCIKDDRLVDESNTIDTSYVDILVGPNIDKPMKKVLEKISDMYDDMYNDMHDAVDVSSKTLVHHKGWILLHRTFVFVDVSLLQVDTIKVIFQLVLILLHRSVLRVG